MTRNITGKEVAEGLYAWMGKNRWFLKDKAGHLDQALEAQARNALQLLAAGDVASYQQQPPAVRGLAVLLMMDFLARVMGPMQHRSWPVPSPGPGDAKLALAAWRVVALETAPAAPPPAGMH